MDDLNMNLMQHWPYVQMLARTIKKRYLQKKSLLIEDLQQCGFVGLMEAAEAFDPKAGIPFLCFAKRRIMGAMWDHIRTFYHTRCETKGHNEEDDNGDKIWFEDILSSDPEPHEHMETVELVDRAQRGLSAPERHLVVGHYLGHKTMHQVGTRLGLCDARMSQINKSFLRRTRERLEAN